MTYEIDEIAPLANGRWFDILHDVAGLSVDVLRNKHQPCPMCGGNDRFRWDDKDGRGTYICTYCGGGDGFALAQKVTGMTFPQTLAAVAEWLNAPGPQGKPRKEIAPAKRHDPKSDWTPVVPMDQKFIDMLSQKTVTVWNVNKESEPGYNGSKLTPELVSIYRTDPSHAVGAVLRIVIDGKKITPQVVQAVHKNGAEALVMMALPKPRTLLGGESVNGDRAVIVVEGEKTQDAVRKIVNSCDVVTWAGGAKAYKDTDWEILSGLTVYLCPDNDELGFAAMHGIKTILEGFGAFPHIVPPPTGRREKWDLADAITEDGWTSQDILDHIERSCQQLQEYTDETPIAPKLATGDWAQVKSNGKPLGTLENFELMLQANHVSARYNLISKSLEVNIPGVSSTVDNVDNVALSHIISMASRNEYPTANISDYLCALGDRNAYNPIAMWIASSPWDGVDRITQLLATIPAKDSELRDMLMTRWLVGAVAILFLERQTELHGVLVLKGRQGTGKTKWTRALMPVELSDRYIMTGAMLDPSSKDSVTSCISNWIVELGELGATMRKADQDRLKAFLTNSVDRLRRPYARIDSTFQRRTTFIASVNDERFLKDSTGDRRYWVIEIDGMIDYQHGLDMQQVWAQALALYRAGTPHWLSYEEQEYLGYHNAKHREVCPITERLTSCLDWESHTATWRDITATDLLIELGFNNITPGLANRCSQILTDLGCEYVKRKYTRLRRVPDRK